MAVCQFSRCHAKTFEASEERGVHSRELRRDRKEAAEKQEAYLKRKDDKVEENYPGLAVLLLHLLQMASRAWQGM